LHPRAARRGGKLWPGRPGHADRERRPHRPRRCHAEPQAPV